MSTQATPKQGKWKTIVMFPRARRDGKGVDIVAAPQVGGRIVLVPNGIVATITHKREVFFHRNVNPDLNFQQDELGRVKSYAS